MGSSPIASTKKTKWKIGRVVYDDSLENCCATEKASRVRIPCLPPKNNIGTWRNGRRTMFKALKTVGSTPTVLTKYLIWMSGRVVYDSSLENCSAT